MRPRQASFTTDFVGVTEDHPAPLETEPFLIENPFLFDDFATDLFGASLPPLPFIEDPTTDEGIFLLPMPTTLENPLPPRVGQTPENPKRKLSSTGDVDEGKQPPSKKRKLPTDEVKIAKHTDDILSRYCLDNREDTLTVSSVGLGFGASSTIYKASYRGSDVAVKNRTNQHFFQNWGLEIKIMGTLRDKHVPGVLLLEGYFNCFEFDTNGKAVMTSSNLVVEFMDGGTLLETISRKDYAYFNTAERLIQAQLQMAYPLKSMHALGYLHNDVKSENYLLRKKINYDLQIVEAEIKLCDFGLSSAIDDTELYSAPKKPGTPVYMAPEVADQYGPGMNSTASDVFSLMITYWELLAKDSADAFYRSVIAQKQLPHSRMSLAILLSQGIRPTLPADDTVCARSVRTMIERGMFGTPLLRPSMSEVVQCLEDNLEKEKSRVESKQTSWLNLLL